MKSFFLSTLAALNLLVPASVQAAPQAVNSIVAKANGEVITYNELMIKVAPMQSVLMSQNPRRGPRYERQLAELKNAMLDELIDRTIIFSEYKEFLQNIPDNAIEEEIERVIRTVYAGDRKLFKDYLKATKLTQAQFKEQQRKEMLVSYIRREQYGEVLPATDKELQIEYASWSRANRDRQKDVGTYRRIYILKKSPTDKEAELTLAEDLVAQLKNGADFGELAKQYSGDSKAANGGLWKDTPRTDLNHEFGFAIFETETKEVLGPFEDQYGFNIIQIIERNYGPSQPYSEVKDLMKKRVKGQKENLNFEKWMKKLRARVPIQKMI